MHKGLHRNSIIKKITGYSALFLSMTLFSNNLYAENLVTNSGFEDNSNGWTVTGTTSAQAIESSGREGNRLTHYSSSSSYNVNTYQTISGLSQGTYDLSVYSVGGNSDEAYLYASNCGGSDVQINIPAIEWGNWTQVSLSNIEVTNGSCTIGVASTNSDWTSYDDFSFELVSSTEPDPDPTPNGNVTFSVDMSGTSATSAYVTGSFTGDSSWSIIAMTNEGNGIYSYTTTIEESSEGGYYFLSGNSWGDRETVPTACALQYDSDRQYTITNGMNTYAYQWESCSEIGVTDPDPEPTEGTAVSILADHGFNYARLRLLVNPPGDYGLNQDLAYVIKMAQEAKSKNMKLLLDIFYSDWWADPGQNYAPTAWSNYNISTLESKVYSYTQDVLTQMENAGVLPDMVQVGNEVNPGMCWSLGEISTNGWGNFVRLTNSGYDAVKNISSTIPVIIHYAGVGSEAISWYSSYDSNGGKMDALGMSFYEMWHGNMNDATSTISSLYNTYRKDIFLVETAAYWTSSDAGSSTSYPHTKQGQYDYLYDLTTAVKNINGFAGLFYWGTTWTQSNQWLDAPDWGDDDASTRSLFDNNAQVTPAVDAIMDAGGLPIMGVDISEAHFIESNGVVYKDLN